MKRTRILFLSLALLAGLQMIWWAYLVIVQQGEIASLINDRQAFEKAESYQRMIVLESIFFISVWTLGIWYVYRSFNKEIKLHNEKKSFLSLITHDLKTPLAIIQMSLETLQRPNLDEAKEKTYRQRATKAVNRLNTQIEKIIHFNEIDKRREKEKIALKPLIEKIIKNLYEDKVDYSLKLEELSISGSVEEIEASIQNIISNAIKYSSIEQEAKVKIHLYEKNKKIYLDITDNGIGFSKQDLASAFKPFWRGEVAKTLAINGSGIGLNLAKELCKKNKAVISIFSEGPNKGANVRIVWPRGNT